MTTPIRKIRRKLVCNKCGSADTEAITNVGPICKKCGGTDFRWVIRSPAQQARDDRPAQIRGHMEGMVRIANRHGFFLEERKSDSYRVLRNAKTGERLEIELLEMT
jgi:predicted  nucleic acid-binding Zn-ribbon protein